MHYGRVQRTKSHTDDHTPVLTEKITLAESAVVDRSLLVTKGRWRKYLRKDLTGEKFCRLTVLGPVRVIKTFNRKATELEWLCQCDCGNKTLARNSALTTVVRSGQKRSCGCLQVDIQRELNTSHGYASSDTYGGSSRTYRCWVAMKSSCYDENKKCYANIGGLGIKVCESWLNSFDNFLADMGDKPDGFALSRLNLDHDFEPGNVEWVPLSIVRSRSSRSYTHGIRDFSDERYSDG